MFEETKSTSISIYGYLDFREFVRARLQELKKARWYSERNFAKRAGFKSPSFLKMILDGKRKLTASSLVGLVKGLALSKPEAKFFEALVMFNQSSDIAEKDELYRKLITFKKFQKVKQVESAQYEYLSRWYYVALREALQTKIGGKNVSELASALEVSERQVQEGLEVLKKLGFLDKAEAQVKDGAVQTPAEVQSLTVRNFHREMIGKALEAIDRVPQEERDLGALTISLSRNNYLEVKRRIAQLRREINALFSEDQEADQVYQLNFQLFPLLKKNKSGAQS